jgi:hypothetical protein
MEFVNPPINAATTTITVKETHILSIFVSLHYFIFYLPSIRYY